MRVFIFLILFALAAPANAWSPFGPNNYDQCILKNTKDVTDQTALALIVTSCAREFPDKESFPACKERELNLDEKNNIKNEISIIKSTLYVEVKIYNGNEKIKLTDASIKISAININPPQTFKLLVRKDSSPSIPPQTTGVGTATIFVFPEGAGKVNMELVSMKTCD